MPRHPRHPHPAVNNQRPTDKPEMAVPTTENGEHEMSIKDKPKTFTTYSPKAPPADEAYYSDWLSDHLERWQQAGLFHFHDEYMGAFALMCEQQGAEDPDEAPTVMELLEKGFFKTYGRLHGALNWAREQWFDGEGIGESMAEYLGMTKAEWEKWHYEGILPRVVHPPCTSMCCCSTQSIEYLEPHKPPGGKLVVLSKNSPARKRQLVRGGTRYLEKQNPGNGPDLFS